MKPKRQQPAPEPEPETLRAILPGETEVTVSLEGATIFRHEKGQVRVVAGPYFSREAALRDYELLITPKTAKKTAKKGRRK